MIKHSLTFRAISLMVSMVFLISCSPKSSPVAEQVIVSSSTTSALENEVGTLTATSTASIVDTPVPSPTSMKWPNEAITAENVGSLKELNRWGHGSILRIEKLNHKSGEYLVLTPLGLYWYTNTTSLLTFIAEADDFVLSQDGHSLAVSMKNGDVQVWDLDAISVNQTLTHKFPEDVIQKIKGHELLPYFVGGMAFSPDGSQIAVGYVDGKIEISRLGESTPYTILQNDALALWKTDLGLLYELSFSPDSKSIVAFKFEPYINANRITFWSLPDGKLMSVSDAGRYYRIPATPYLPDGKTMLIFARDDSYLRGTLWDVETGKQINEFETGFAKISSTELMPAGDQLILYGSDAQENTFRQVRTLPDGKLVGDEKLNQIPEDKDLSLFQALLTLHGHYANSWGIDEKPQVARLISTERTSIQILQENYLLALPDGKIQQSKLPENAVNAYYDPQGKFIAWCESGKMNILNQEETILSTELPFSSSCDGLTVSSQQHYAAVWKGTTFYLLNLVTGKSNKASFNRQWDSTLMLSASFATDEKTLLSSKMGLITLWQVDPFQRLADSDKEIQYIGNNVGLALSKDNTLAVSLSVSKGTTQDRTSQLIVWRVQDAFPLHRINPPMIDLIQPMFTSFALSPDGSLIASGDDFGEIRFWSVQSGEELGSYSFDVRPLDLAFIPEGSGLIIVLEDGTVRLLGVP